MDQFCSNGIGHKLRLMINFHCVSIKQWGQFSSCGVAALLNAHREQHWLQQHIHYSLWGTISSFPLTATKFVFECSGSTGNTWQDATMFGRKCSFHQKPLLLFALAVCFVSLLMSSRAIKTLQICACFFVLFLSVGTSRWRPPAVSEGARRGCGQGEGAGEEGPRTGAGGWE